MRTITKRAIQGALAATLALGGIAATGGSAQAYGNTDWWNPNGLPYWLGGNNNTGRCVDDSSAPSLPDGNLLRGFPCFQSNYDGGWQKWKVNAMANGYAQLKNGATGLCLDDSTRSDGTDYLRGFPCYPQSLSGGWQGWRIVNRTRANGYYEQVLQNAATGRCLDDSNAGPNGSDLLRGYVCNGTSQDNGYQGWDIWT
ncbi:MULTISPECIES: RICIN domain-containing protein [unclassified Streptomyces]|uniref:RICIN domain-containing protein n=1 Tax=unclassified Streptomyces TaxID=2593676 RepID=UPI002E230599|nr:RICIN domain-containing protein [Streptomyces sp. NBC_01023]